MQPALTGLRRCSRGVQVLPPFQPAPWKKGGRKKKVWKYSRESDRHLLACSRWQENYTQYHQCGRAAGPVCFFYSKAVVGTPGGRYMTVETMESGAGVRIEAKNWCLERSNATINHPEGEAP